MNGLDLQRQIVAANSRIPIIFITSHADDMRERAPSKPTRWPFCTNLSANWMIGGPQLVRELELRSL